MLIIAVDFYLRVEITPDPSEGVFEWVLWGLDHFTLNRRSKLDVLENGLEEGHSFLTAAIWRKEELSVIKDLVKQVFQIENSSSSVFCVGMLYRQERKTRE